MIHAFISYNPHTKDTLFRPFTPIPEQTQSTLVHTFTTSILKKSPVSSTYTYTSTLLDSTHFAFIHDSTTTTHEANHVLSHIKPLLTSDNYANLYIVNEILQYSNVPVEPNYNLVPLDSLRAILLCESNEERIYKNMMKSKEVENYKKIKEMKEMRDGRETKKGRSDNIEVQLEKVRTLEIEMRNEQLMQLEKMKSEKNERTGVGSRDANLKSKSKRVRKKVDGDIVVTIKEKLNVKVDREGVISECYINGDLSVNVSKEECRKEEIVFSRDVDCKYSPNIDKKRVDENVLWSGRGYPLNKNVALMKWKKNVDMPISFSFWTSELSDEKSMVQLEFDSGIKLNDVVFNFNRNGVSIDNKNVSVMNDRLEWRCEEGRSLEIVCDNLEDVFSVDVDFWSEDQKMCVDVKETGNIKVVKIFEVEKFEIVY